MSEGLPRGQGGVERPSRRFGRGREPLLEVRVGFEALLEVREALWWSMRGLEALPKDRVGFKGPP